MSEVKVRLRPITEADLPDYVRWFDDPEVTEFLDIEPGRITMEFEREWFARVTAPDNPARHLAIEAHSRHIGNCALNPDAARQIGNFGIVIADKTAWDKGYGTAATREVLRIGFQEMGLHRIQLQVFGPNTRALRCYRKCGFRHEGVKRQAFLKRGKWLDVVMMGILREEWGATRIPTEPGVTDVRIRSYRRTNYEQVIALWRAVGFDPGARDSQEALDYKVTHDRGPFLIAELAGRIVGTAMGSWDGRRASVSRVAVDPNMQRRGIGRALMAEVESRLAALGAQRVVLYTPRDNLAAKCFYESQGYQALDYLVVMRKDLGAREEQCRGS